MVCLICGSVHTKYIFTPTPTTIRTEEYYLCASPACFILLSRHVAVYENGKHGAQELLANTRKLKVIAHAGGDATGAQSQASLGTKLQPEDAQNGVTIFTEEVNYFKQTKKLTSKLIERLLQEPDIRKNYAILGPLHAEKVLLERASQSGEANKAPVPQQHCILWHAPAQQYYLVTLDAPGRAVVWQTTRAENKQFKADVVNQIQCLVSNPDVQIAYEIVDTAGAGADSSLQILSVLYERILRLPVPSYEHLLDFFTRLAV